jgi:hypothetical protein
MDQWQAFVNIVMNHCAALNARNFLGSWTIMNFSRTVLHGVKYKTKSLNSQIKNKWSP